MLAFGLLSALSLLSLAGAQQYNPNFSGTGEIWVVKGSTTSTDPNSALGCLTTTGAFAPFAPGGCGAFTRDASGNTKPFFSSAGQCTFLDTSASAGTGGVYALKCGTPSQGGESWYALGTGTDYIFWGNLDFQYKLQGSNVFPEYDAPAGSSTEVLLYWNKLF